MSIKLKDLLKEDDDHKQKMIIWFKDRWKDYSISKLKKKLGELYQGDKEAYYLIPMLKTLIKDKQKNLNGAL